MSVHNAKLSSLTPDPNNLNKGTERGQGLLENSLRKYGAGRSILLDKNGIIIAGNKTAENAGQIGMDDLIVVETDGTKLVAVKRMDLDMNDAPAKMLALADNRVAELDLSWDVNALASLPMNDVLDFWQPEELTDLFSSSSSNSGGANDSQGMAVTEALQYRVIVECTTESQQVEIMEELEGRGLKCKLMIS